MTTSVRVEISIFEKALVDASLRALRDSVRQDGDTSTPQCTLHGRTTRNYRHCHAIDWQG